MQSDTELLDALEHDIAVRDGVATEQDLAGVAELLADRSILPAIAGVLSDPSEPEPARLRALSRAMAALRWTDTSTAAVG
jgi:hypothetical protein